MRSSLRILLFALIGFALGLGPAASTVSWSHARSFAAGEAEPTCGSTACRPARLAQQVGGSGHAGAMSGEAAAGAVCCHRTAAPPSPTAIVHATAPEGACPGPDAKAGAQSALRANPADCCGSSKSPERGSTPPNAPLRRGGEEASLQPGACACPCWERPHRPTGPASFPGPTAPSPGSSGNHHLLLLLNILSHAVTGRVDGATASAGTAGAARALSMSPLTVERAASAHPSRLRDQGRCHAGLGAWLT